VLRVRQSKAFGLHTFCILSAYFIKNNYITTRINSIKHKITTKSSNAFSMCVRSIYILNNQLFQELMKTTSQLYQQLQLHRSK